jgi:hypothetical protein
MKRWVKGTPPYLKCLSQYTGFFPPGQCVFGFCPRIGVQNLSINFSDVFKLPDVYCGQQVKTGEKFKEAINYLHTFDMISRYDETHGQTAPAAGSETKLSGIHN